jgi:hypothetical protein
MEVGGLSYIGCHGNPMAIAAKSGISLANNRQELGQNEPLPPGRPRKRFTYFFHPGIGLWHQFLPRGAGKPNEKRTLNSLQMMLWK